MRWCFADRIDGFEPWTLIDGHKCVSLEEYSLLEPLGREGEFPESLVIESCIHFARWLVAASSGFTSLAVLRQVSSFSFDARIRAGARIDVCVRVESRAGNLLTVRCTVSAGAADAAGSAEGTLWLEILPSSGLYDAAELEMLWTELYGAPDRKK